MWKTSVNKKSEYDKNVSEIEPNFSKSMRFKSDPVTRRRTEP